MTRCWDVLEMNGLESGEDALRVNMMAELLTNVFLLGGCLDYFDGVPTPWVWTATWPWSPSTLMRGLLRISATSQPPCASFEATSCRRGMSLA